MKSAETALLTLNGRKIFDMEIKCNWAHQNQPSLARGHANGNGANGAPAHASNGAPTDDSLSQYHVFVGDLSAEVNDQVLHQAFSAHGTLTDARVMFDAITGRTRGFGFVAFSRKEDAEQAIAKMNGEWLGSRAIRVNWANQKNSVSCLEFGIQPCVKGK
jgi:nucleolysin TIA-1/TIAR